MELCAKHTIPVFRSPTSRKQPILPFDVRVSINTFQHNAGRDLAELFGFDFVEQVARTCGLGSRLFVVNWGRTANLQNRSALLATCHGKRQLDVEYRPMGSESGNVG